MLAYITPRNEEEMKRKKSSETYSFLKKNLQSKMKENRARLLNLAYVTLRDEGEAKERKTCSFLKKSKIKKNRARFLHLACVTNQKKLISLHARLT